MHRILKFEVVDPVAFRATMRRLYPGFRYKTEDEALNQLVTGSQPIPVSQLGCKLVIVEPLHSGSAPSAEPWDAPAEEQPLAADLEVPQAHESEAGLQAQILELAREGLSLRAISRWLRDQKGIQVSHTRVGQIIREGGEP